MSTQPSKPSEQPRHQSNENEQLTAAYSGSAEAIPASDEFASKAHVQSMDQYRSMYADSINEPEAFWKQQAKRLTWMQDFTSVKDVSFDASNLAIKWFDGGKLNASYNCIDRHLPVHADRVALICEPDDPTASVEKITYQDLYDNVCRVANVLKKHGVKKGDRVTIYMPMIPQVAYAMQACARIGAVHSVVFAGFSPESLSDRILDCDSTFVITADEGRRGGRTVPLKKNVDEALLRCPEVERVLVYRNTGGAVNWEEGRDLDYAEEVTSVSAHCEPEPMESEDPLFILYTSGSTGKPKGVLHTTAGYLLYAALTHHYVFDYHPGDVFWCTADVGWITGHSYMVYGPLVNAATQVFFEGIPTYPDASRFWQVVDKHRVSIFYTAPTAIRALMAQGDEFVAGTKRSSLRLLGTVGEPINPEAWRWYHRVVGDGRCPIVDTWWQTETGGIMITPIPGAVPQKPGSATLPFFGIMPEVLDADGEVLEGPCEGLLVMRDSWPGQMRTVYRSHERFVDTYFSRFPGKYFAGDGCRRDEDGYYWITGRVDDVLNVSGHRIGTAEVESALVSHPAVSEAAVVGYPHNIKGQGIYCYVTLGADRSPSDQLHDELIQHVRAQIGPIAKPDVLRFTPALPKTRSGKIMRRILRQIAAGKVDELGDTSTLADPSVVSSLVSDASRS